MNDQQYQDILNFEALEREVLEWAPPARPEESSHSWLIQEWEEEEAARLLLLEPNRAAVIAVW